MHDKIMKAMPNLWALKLKKKKNPKTSDKKGV